MPRFVCTIPNTPAGNIAIEDLKRVEPRSVKDVTYLRSLSDLLLSSDNERGALIAAEQVRTLPWTFHEIEITDGHEKDALHALLRRHNDPNGRRPGRGHIEAIEPNLRLHLCGLGLPFHLGGHHGSYLGMLNVPAMHLTGVRGSNVTVAVIDTGSDNLPFVNDYYDLTGGGSTHPGAHAQTDVNGHGTAMATLVHEVAPDARIEMIRVTDDEPEYLHLLAAVSVAAYDCRAAVVCMSLGFKDWGGICGVCGTDGVSRSIAMEKLLNALLDVDPSAVPGYVQPIYVAPTGNDGTATGFYYPAQFDFVVAVGATDSTLQRSSFSTYGSSHSRYLLAPGGQEVNTGGVTSVTEDVGHGHAHSHAHGHGWLNPCHGTSVATAYVAGLMALAASDPRFAGSPVDSIVDAVLQMCTVPPGASAQEYGSGVVSYR